ncbi:hypothetical protein ACUOFC_45315, partial [Escherichia sp. TWPC-MK]
MNQTLLSSFGTPFERVENALPAREVGKRGPGDSDQKVLR